MASECMAEKLEGEKEIPINIDVSEQIQWSKMACCENISNIPLTSLTPS